MLFEENIKKLKIDLPDAKAPVGSYVATKIVGKLLYIFGFWVVVFFNGPSIRLQADEQNRYTLIDEKP